MSITKINTRSATALDATILTGNLPALNASSLTNLDAGDLENALPAISGASLTNLVAGKIGQVLQGIYATQVTVNSETYTQVGASVSITPSATSSKVLVMFYGGMVQEGQLQKNGVMQVYRDTTGLGNVQGHLGYSYTSSSYNAKTEYSWPHITALDSPSSTSSLAYMVKAKMSQDSGQHVWNYAQQNGTRSYMIVMEVLA